VRSWTPAIELHQQARVVGQLAYGEKQKAKDAIVDPIEQLGKIYEQELQLVKLKQMINENIFLLNKQAKQIAELKIELMKKDTIIQKSAFTDSDSKVEMVEEVKDLPTSFTRISVFPYFRGFP